MSKQNKNKLIGRWRLFWGNCPACNSDAPEMYECGVCDFKYDYWGRGKKGDRKFWWGRFVTRLRFKVPLND